MFSVESAKVVREGSKLKALLRVSWCAETSGDNPTFQEQSSTLAYFDRPGIPTPAFTLVPSSGAQGFLQDMFAGITGLGIDFPDFPEFGNRFSVMTFFPRSTRALLTEKLTKAFIERGGMTVQRYRGPPATCIYFRRLERQVRSKTGRSSPIPPTLPVTATTALPTLIGKT